MGIGNNVCFCYENMEWTTGDASDGVSGFGGVPATVGVNNGDGVKFSQFGRFNSTGNGINGIDLLDGQTTCFSAGAAVGNIPPVAIGVPVDLACDEAVKNLVITFAAPEANQTVTLTKAAEPGVTVVTNDGIQTAVATINWTPSDGAVANLVIAATDNLGATTTVQLTFTDCAEITATPTTAIPTSMPTSAPSFRVNFLPTTAKPQQGESRKPSRQPSRQQSRQPSRQPSRKPNTT